MSALTTATSKKSCSSSKRIFKISICSLLLNVQSKNIYRSQKVNKNKDPNRYRLSLSRKVRCVMKTEIILAAILTSLSIGERQQRSTVLTDESKRILEHFDFSNFDKQEALNYIDRQRYENQIRGKRSQSKLKREQNDKDGIEDNDLDKKELEPEPELESQFETEIDNNNDETDLPLEPEPELGPEPSPNLKNLEGKDSMGQVNEKPFSINSLDNLNNRQAKSKLIGKKDKRGRLKKKKKSSLTRYNYDDDYSDEEEGEYQTRRQRKFKKKKKKKRHYWDHWSEWSPCSVTCGRGRKIRWRKCIAKNCTTGELEMGEKTCQLPACNLLTKLLGL